MTSELFELGQVWESIHLNDFYVNTIGLQGSYTLPLGFGDMLFVVWVGGDRKVCHCIHLRTQRKVMIHWHWTQHRIKLLEEETCLPLP